MDDDTIKKLREERKRKVRKRFVIGISSAVIIIIIISAYAFYDSVQDTYWKPDKVMKIPSVNWNAVNDSYVVKRKYYNDEINGTIINKTIGDEKSNGKFRVCILTKIKSYVYRPGEDDILSTVPEVFAEKVGGDYVVKELVFHYDFGDGYLSTTSIMYHNFEAKNMYFLATEGNFDGYAEKISYEWWVLHQLRGINKDAKDIKECGFSWDFEIDMDDEYPHWVNHTITLTATLYYGHPTIFGWQDVHKLSASVVIYVVPEGGE